MVKDENKIILQNCNICCFYIFNFGVKNERKVGLFVGIFVVDFVYIFYWYLIYQVRFGIGDVKLDGCELVDLSRVICDLQFDFYLFFLDLIIVDKILKMFYIMRQSFVVNFWLVFDFYNCYLVSEYLGRGGM